MKIPRYTKQWNKIICLFIGHIRGRSTVKREALHYIWTITCKRCGYKISYRSPLARLVGIEMEYGFDGN